MEKKVMKSTKTKSSAEKPTPSREGPTKDKELMQEPMQEPMHMHHDEGCC